MEQSLTDSEGPRIEEDRRVILRRLSTGHPASPFPAAGLSGRIRAREQARLTVEMDPLIAAHAVAAGDLVEIRAADAVYLGLVKALRGMLLTVVIEHALDLASLDAIQRIWGHRQPPGPDRERQASE
jgi:hypothetical protein